MIINNLSEFHPNDEKIDFIYEMFIPNSYERDKRKFNQLLSENKSYFKEIINISQNSIEIIEKIICGWEENKIKFNFDHFISIHEVIKKILLNTYEGIFKDLKVENKYNKFIIFFKNNLSSIKSFLKDVILFDKNIIKEKLSKNNFLIILFFLLSLNSANISKNYLYKEINCDENLIIIFLIAFSEVIILNYEKCINGYSYINNEKSSIFCEFYEKIKEFDNFINDFIEKNILILNKINFEIEIDFYFDISIFLNNYYYECSGDFLKNFFSFITNIFNAQKNKLILEDKILYKIINYCKNKINNN